MKSINRTVRKNAKSIKAAIYKMLSSIGHSDFKPFIVLSRSRTGTNLLLSYLNSHPNIRAEGELFRRLNGRSYKSILSKTFSKQPFYIQAKGFKIFYYHPLDDSSSHIWKDLNNLASLSVIHMKRRNIFRTLISRKIAGSQNVWKATSSNDLRMNKSIMFSVEELEHGFKQTRKWERGGDELFRNHPVLSVYYEDLVEDVEGTFAEITNFLGVRCIKPKTKMLKQNPETQIDLVTNYSELRQVFSGTKWESFFEL